MLICKTAVKDAVLRRDDRRCVCCSATDRIAVRARRTSDELLPAKRQQQVISAADLITLCETDFVRIRASAAGLPDRNEYHSALSLGWQIKTMSAVPNAEVPIYYRDESRWFRVNPDGSRDELHPVIARELIATAGGQLTQEGAIDA